MADLNDKDRKSVNGCAVKVIKDIDDCIGRLRKTGDNIPWSSVDYHLLSTSIQALTEAKGNLDIVARRTREKKS